MTELTFQIIKQDHSLPQVILCDIDGTIAHMNGRGPYEWEKVSSDSPDDIIISLLKAVSTQYPILFVSGRREECRKETEEWLKLHIPCSYSHLLMRKSGDTRNDAIVKREILEELVKEYSILCVFDDRDRVVKMWRESGIKVLQVAYGDF